MTITLFFNKQYKSNIFFVICKTINDLFSLFLSMPESYLELIFIVK